MDSGFVRQVAFKLRVSDVLRGEYVRSGSVTEPSFVRVGEFKFLRVNLFGKAVKLEAGGFLLDDCTAQVRVRLFGAAAEEVKEGAAVKVIGKVREDAVGRYVAAETVKNVAEPDYFRLRELEVLKIQ